MRVRHLPAFVLASFIGMNASASPLTYEFSGVFAGGAASSGPNPFWYDFNVPDGTAFSGSFTLETETAPSVVNEEASVFRNVVTAASVAIGQGGSYGTYTLGGNMPDKDYSSQLLLIDDSTFEGPIPFDQLSLGVTLDSVPGDAPGLLRGFSLNSWSTTGDLFTTRPTIETAFAPFVRPDTFIQFGFGVGSHDENGEEITSSLIANIDEIHVRSVPEPGTLALMAFGLLGVFGVSRGRRVTNN